MSTAKHTPGPWKVIDSIQHESEESYAVRRLIGQRQCIHAIGQPWLDENIAIIESECDEAILAAAPAMYEALKALVEYLDTQVQAGKLDDWKHVLVARQALAQAEGRHS